MLNINYFVYLCRIKRYYDMSESQNIEYKESWRDEYLKWVCGFANAQGGKIYIGIADNQEIVGVEDAKRLMDDIPNKIVNALGIVADVNLLDKDGKQYIEIVVEPSPVPISLKGVYHYRSGATKQVLNGAALQLFLLKKMGKTWDDVERVAYSDDLIDRKAVDYFLQKGIKADRIDATLIDEDTKTILDNLELLTEDGSLKNAAVLLFAKRPQRYFTGVQFKLGRFGIDESDLIFEDVVEGNILQMADRVVDLLKSKYLISPIHYEGMQRVATLEIPEEALREMLYNACVHKDYRGAPIMMWIYNDHIELWNEGPLPENMDVSALLKKHKSRQRNPKIANVFYRAGLIEIFGRGINKIRKGFEDADMDMPVFKEEECGLTVTFNRKNQVNTIHDQSGTGQVQDKHRTSTDQVPHKYHISTTQVKYLWDSMEDSKEYSSSELMSLLGIKNRSHFIKKILQEAVRNEIIEPIYPDQPRHPRQKYRRKR